MMLHTPKPRSSRYFFRENFSFFCLIETIFAIIAHKAGVHISAMTIYPLPPRMYIASTIADSTITSIT